MESQLELVANQIVRVSLLSSWINSMLFIFELTLVYRYIRRNHFSRAGAWTQGLVIILLLLDTIGTVMSCVNAWMFVVEHAVLPVVRYVWAMPIIVLTTAIGSVLEQGFMIYRIFILSKGYLSCSFLMLLVVIHIIFTTISAAYVATYPHLRLDFVTTTTTISFCTEAMVNILIPIALVWHLRKYESHFPSTQSVIRRVLMYAFSSGFVAAAVGIMLLVLFWVGSVAFIEMPNFHGRIYGITVVANLMIRECTNSESYRHSKSATDPNPAITLSDLNTDNTRLDTNNTHFNTAESFERSISHQDYVDSVITNPTSIHETHSKPSDIIP